MAGAQRLIFDCLSPVASKASGCESPGAVTNRGAVLSQLPPTGSSTDSLLKHSIKLSMKEAYLSSWSFGLRGRILLFGTHLEVTLGAIFVLSLGPTPGLPWWFRQKRTCLQCRRPGFDPWVRKIPWRREWLPTPVLLHGEFHGQRSLGGYSPWGHKELDTTEWLFFLIFESDSTLLISPREELALSSGVPLKWL